MSEPARHYRYPPEAFPGYIIAAISSTTATWLVTLLSNRNPFPWQGVHSYLSVVATMQIAIFLAWSLVRARTRWPTVRIVREDIVAECSGRSRKRPLDDIDSVDETRGRFFGRPSLILTIHFCDGSSLSVSDFLVGYHELRRALGISTEHNTSLGEREKNRRFHLLERAKAREESFGARSSFDRVALAALGFIPLIAMDLIVTLTLIHEVFAKGSITPNPAAWWAIPICFMGSSLLSRFCFYYMLSSRRLHGGSMMLSGDA